MAKTEASDPTNIPDGVPEERVDALYGLPLDEFTPARDALAKELRREGKRDGANWVKGLRKPSGPAWVVNQLARTQTPEAKELEDSAEVLRGAHERLLQGQGQADDLREAADRQNEAVLTLLDKAHGLLDGAGNSPSQATLEKTQQTLEAIAVDENSRAAFASGRFTYEARPIGLGLLGGAVVPPKAGGRPSESRLKRNQSDEKQRAKVRASADEARAEEDARRRAKERAEARKALEKAKDKERAQQLTLERAEGETDRRRREVEEAQARLEEAEGELERVRALHAEAIAAAEHAEEHLGRLA
jgi:hypothetical protein